MVANFAARGTDMAHSLASQSLGLGKQDPPLDRSDQVLSPRSLDHLTHRPSVRLENTFLANFLPWLMVYDH